MRQPANSPHAAQERYLRYLQLSLSCLTDAVWYVAPSRSSADTKVRVLTLNPDPVRLKREHGRTLRLSANQRFALIEDERYVGEWKAQTRGFVYSIYLESSASTEDDLEVIGWHWHPQTTPDRPQPHIHVSAEHPMLDGTLKRLHVPSGRVAFEEVVRFLIAELHAQPNRQDWEDVLKDSENRFRAYRTWA